MVDTLESLKELGAVSMEDVGILGEWSCAQDG
jgi:hypothetical protein